MNLQLQFVFSSRILCVQYTFTTVNKNLHIKFEVNVRLKWFLLNWRRRTHGTQVALFFHIFWFHQQQRACLLYTSLLTSASPSALVILAVSHFKLVLLLYNLSTFFETIALLASPHISILTRIIHFNNHTSENINKQHNLNKSQWCLHSHVSYQLEHASTKKISHMAQGITPSRWNLLGSFRTIWRIVWSDYWKKSIYAYTPLFRQCPKL